MSHRALLRVRNLACSVLLTFLSALSGSAAWGQSQARITHAIDDTSAVRISRTTHPLATPMNDRGRAASDLPMERMMLVLRPAEAQRAAAAKLIGAGLAMIGTIGAGAGIGIVVNGAVQGMARNPDASGNVQVNMILGIAFAEAVAIYCLVVALLILFVF